MNQDAEHLRLLSIFHYVMAGLTALFASIPLIHVTIGLMMLISPSFGGKPDAAVPIVGLMFTLIGGSIVLAGWSAAIMMALAGRYLREQTHYTFCLVIAVVACMFGPFGPVLGVFTIIVLMKPSVKQSFATNSDLGSARKDDEGTTQQARYSERSEPPNWR
jgi:hypothetical protein